MSVAQHTEGSSAIEQTKIGLDDIEDGDLALKVLHTHFEPFSKEEEKRVLRKIDYRLASLMLIINGIQFVDKLVSLSIFSHLANTADQKTDYLSSCHIWPYHRGPSERAGIFTSHQHILHWLPGCTIPNQHSHATIPHRQIHHH